MREAPKLRGLLSYRTQFRAASARGARWLPGGSFLARTGRASGVVIALYVAAGAAPARADRLLELKLREPPHAPGDAPDVIIHVPSHYRASDALELVVFLHGFSSCARALLSRVPVPCEGGGLPQPGQGLAALHERAHTDTLLIVPQLAFLARRSEAPRFARPGGFDALLDELFRGPLRDLVTERARLASRVTLVAHSGGYRAAAEILRDPHRRANVARLVLLDALYAHWDVFARWARAQAEPRLVSLYTRDPKTTRGNLRLATALKVVAGEGAALGSRLAAEPIVVARVRTPHGALPERHLAAILRALVTRRGARRTGRTRRVP